MTISAKHAFSILGRIERDATDMIRDGSIVTYKLSVSSVGSSGMQLTIAPKY